MTADEFKRRTTSLFKLGAKLNLKGAVSGEAMTFNVSLVCDSLGAYGGDLEDGRCRVFVNEDPIGDPIGFDLVVNVADLS